MMVVADPKTTSRDDNTRRPPLLPSERDNAKKPKARHVSSRYLSPSPSPSPSPSTSTASRRSPSPLVSRNSTPPVKRSVSVDRKRPVGSRPLTPDLVSRPGEMSAATKLLVTSTRSLSVSFQGEAFSLPVSKTKLAPPTPNLRKTTPERKRTNTPSRTGGDHLENSRPIDQQRWPGRTRQEHPLSRSLDCTGDRSKLAGSGNVIRALKQSMISDSRRASLDGNAQLLKPFQHTPDGNSQSDTESVSSGSNSGAQECGRGCGGSAPRGISVSARFWQETNTRLRRLQDPGSQLSTSPGSKIAGPPKFIQSKKYPSDGSVVSLSSPRKMASPLRGGTRPASPSKLNSPSLSRGMISPSRVRSAFAATTTSTSTSTSSSGNFSETPSVLSYAVDVRRGKVGENRIVDAHLLRLLYNRQLQWRFVNARTEAALRAQKRSAEKTLWNAWITISDLRDSVTKRRHRLQLMKQKLKLASVLKKQITFLEDWASLDKDHYVSLLGAIEALKASTLRLPVIGGAIADIQSMKDAISSAFDVMQAMASSICSHLSKVDEVDSLLAQLANETANERALLQQCKDFLSMLAAMQVTDCSLRTHILQLNRVPST